MRLQTCTRAARRAYRNADATQQPLGAAAHRYRIAPMAGASEPNWFFTAGTPQRAAMVEWCPPTLSSKGYTNHSIIRRLAEMPPGLIIDVGAFDGSDAIAYGSAGQHRVWSFEPTPSKVDYIRERLRAASVAKSVKLFAMALSNYSGKAHFMLSTPRHGYEKYLVNGSQQDMLVDATKNITNPADLAKLVEVPVITLDNLLSEHSHVGGMPIHYMKVDAQGFDFHVLKGAEKTFRARRVGMMSFEFSPRLVPAPPGCAAPDDVRTCRLREAAEGLRYLQRLGADCIPCDDWTSVKSKTTAPRSIGNYMEAFYRRGSYYDNIVCNMSRVG